MSQRLDCYDGLRQGSRLGFAVGGCYGGLRIGNLRVPQRLADTRLPLRDGRTDAPRLLTEQAAQQTKETDEEAVLAGGVPREQVVLPVGTPASSLPGQGSAQPGPLH
mmetsp:Transcript_24682/g.11810  ORF Transcript_24682/g.11810 Transcript_24682/m.11810 type:complete len:107 (-) Transcript_24682:147-467(-)